MKIIRLNKSGKSRGSRASRVSKTKSKMSRVSKKSRITAKKSVGGRSRMSKSSKRTAMSRTTTRTKKTKTALSRRENEDPQPTFLTVSHYDKLFRIHSMLTYISYEQKELALDAQYFVLKMWEQSFKTLNAFTFLDKHKEQAEKLGFSDADPEARNLFYNEVFTNPEVQLPNLFQIPETPEGWIDFELPEDLIELCKKHEDKTMIAKWAFQKPEISFYHINHILKILEEHYMLIQMIPVLKLGKLFNDLVLDDAIFGGIFDLKLARVYNNLGLTEKGKLAPLFSSFKLSEETKRIQQENIKGFIDSEENLKRKEASFNPIGKREPFGLEKYKTHEIWIEQAKELMKWGDFLTAKELILEAMFHARVLKQQNDYADCFDILSVISELEGQVVKAITCDMYCQSHAKDLKLISDSINNTLNHLMEAEKQETSSLMSQSLDIMKTMKDKQSDKIVNPELFFTMQHIYLDYAYLTVTKSNKALNLEEARNKFNESIIYLDDYDTLVQQCGTRISHIVKCLNIAQILYT
jgi:hypothetical protein